MRGAPSTVAALLAANFQAEQAQLEHLCSLRAFVLTACKFWVLSPRTAHLRRGGVLLHERNMPADAKRWRSRRLNEAADVRHGRGCQEVVILVCFICGL